MKPRRTHLSNAVYRLPGGNEDDDLWARNMQQEDGVPLICSTWEPTEDERARIAAGENIELILWGGAQPPVAMRLDDTPLGAPPRPIETEGHR